jgi:Transposase DNA-binding/Transposase DDE domain
MKVQRSSAQRWATEEFGKTQLGDVRRTERLVQIASGVARAPSGKVSVVFTGERDREGAYDFLENAHVSAEQVTQAMYRATASRAGVSGHFAYVAVDGSSLKLTEGIAGAKGFGRIGSDDRGARGLKVMNALCIDSQGAPLGLIDQQYWARATSRTAGKTKKEKAKETRKTPFEEKESARFLEASTRAATRLGQAGVRAWIVIDREGDNRGILLGLSDLLCHFTVRASWDRVIADTDQDRHTLRAHLGTQPILGTYDVEVGRTGQRAARVASMTVCVATVELRLRDKHNKAEKRLVTNVVWVCETDASAAAAGKPALDWLLYTNVTTQTREEALAVVRSYTFRWRIEEFHRTWKTGACNVEDTQLRSENAVTVWATILAAKAVRIERLKYLSRATPDALCTLVLREIELEALIHLRKHERLPVSKGSITIALATQWIATLGGWISRNNGPPGSITLARGLETLMQITRGYELVKAFKQN